MLLDLSWERQIIKQDHRFRHVVGIDEVGRGSWAGPFVLGALWINDLEAYTKIPEINDSKKLSKKRRQEIFGLLQLQREQGLLDWKLIWRDAEHISIRGLAGAINSAVGELVYSLGIPVRNQKKFFVFDGHLKPRMNSGVSFDSMIRAFS